jgi:hypothetical protein
MSVVLGKQIAIRKPVDQPDEVKPLVDRLGKMKVYELRANIVA